MTTAERDFDDGQDDVLSATLARNAGRWRNGVLSDSCSKAGSEECDFEWCAADQEGDCMHLRCPQHADNEPRRQRQALPARQAGRMANDA